MYRRGFSAAMACLAFRIVHGIVAVDLVVRIVACRALDAGVIGIVALAAREAIRLKPDVRDAEHSRPGDLVPGAMALATKVRGFFRTHLAEIFHLRQLSIARLDARQVIFRRPVAAFALDAGS